MSRTGIEDKLPWQRVPRSVRAQVEAALGAPVRRAARIWGGYSPTPTFRLALVDGRRAFFKATYGETNEFATRALALETRVYAELGALLAGWAPRCYATFCHDGWQVLLLEDLGPKSAPPWTPALARSTAQALGRFHQATLGAPLPGWLARPDHRLPEENWQRTLLESQQLCAIADLAGDAAPAALAWLHGIAPRIETTMHHPALMSEPFALLHGDLRSDNLRFARQRLYLFDWPAITVGRPEWDMVAFAQTVTVEGGPQPETILAWYGETFSLDPGAVDGALAWWFTFFADCAWRPEIPGLPRLRRFQQQQLAVLAQWASRRWALPDPAWVRNLSMSGVFQ
jgi:fructosamine-3-kinase